MRADRERVGSESLCAPSAVSDAKIQHVRAQIAIPRGADQSVDLHIGDRVWRNDCGDRHLGILLVQIGTDLFGTAQIGKAIENDAARILDAAQNVRGLIGTHEQINAVFPQVCDQLRMFVPAFSDQNQHCMRALCGDLNEGCLVDGNGMNGGGAVGILFIDLGGRDCIHGAHTVYHVAEGCVFLIQRCRGILVHDEEL